MADPMYRQIADIGIGSEVVRQNLRALGVVLHDQGKLAEAVVEYEEAKRLAPEEAAIRNNLGNTFCDKGDYSSAIKEFHDLYKIDPTWEGGHSCLAQACIRRLHGPTHGWGTADERRQCRA